MDQADARACRPGSRDSDARQGRALILASCRMSCLYENITQGSHVPVTGHRQHCAPHVLKHCMHSQPSRIQSCLGMQGAVRDIKYKHFILLHVKEQGTAADDYLLRAPLIALVLHFAAAKLYNRQHADTDCKEW